MTKNKAPTLTRRMALAGMLCAGTFPTLAAPHGVVLRPPLRPGTGGTVKTAARDIVQKVGLSGKVSFAVANAGTGRILESRDADQAVPPASVAKAITTLYALDVLGADYRFVTSLTATGPVVDGVLHGDLILSGGGDPTVDTRDLAVLAEALREAGIRKVDGGFRVYHAALPQIHSIDDGQPDHLAYNPAISGIALNYNRVHFEWRRSSEGYDTLLDARTIGYRPDVNIARMTIEERPYPVYLYEDTGTQDDWSVARSALGKEGGRWLPIRKPGLYAGDVFATLARWLEIDLPAPQLSDEPPQGNTIAQHKSAPLAEILQGMLKYSTNLTAEMVGLWATRSRIGRPDSLEASAEEMNHWARQELGMLTPGFVDHSGLNDRSRIAPDDMVHGLVVAHRKQELRPLLKPFTMRDAKGQLDKNHPVKVDAKTGTLNFVSGLAGFITVPNGPVLAFAIFSGNEEIRRTIPKENREAPRGAKSWATRARRLQRKLLEHWAELGASREE